MLMSSLHCLSNAVKTPRPDRTETRLVPEQFPFAEIVHACRGPGGRVGLLAMQRT